jgi:hypothetical protein
MKDFNIFLKFVRKIQMNCLDNALAVYKVFPDSTKIYYNGDHVIAVVGSRVSGGITTKDDPEKYLEITFCHSFETLMSSWDVLDAETLLKYYKQHYR